MTRGSNGTDQITLTNAPTGSLFVNHILPAYVATQASGTSTALDFISVDNSNNLVPGATTGNYDTSNTLNGGATSIADISATTDIGATTRTVFAVRSTIPVINGSGGTLVVGDDTNPGGIILNQTSLNVSNLQFGPSGLSEGIIWAGAGASTISSAISLSNLMTTAGSSQLTFTGPITLNGGSQSINVDAGTSTITGNLIGGGLNKIGPGVLVLSGSYTSYSGTLTATVGSLQIGDGTADGTISNSSNLVANSNLVSNRSDLVTWGNTITGTGNTCAGRHGNFGLKRRR